MKKIAIIMESWNRYFTYAWPSGMLNRINELGEDINLYIFNCSGKEDVVDSVLCIRG